jgi:hypothetical protein
MRPIWCPGGAAGLQPLFSFPVSTSQTVHGSVIQGDWHVSAGISKSLSSRGGRPKLRRSGDEYDLLENYPRCCSDQRNWNGGMRPRFGSSAS